MGLAAKDGRVGYRAEGHKGSLVHRVTQTAAKLAGSVRACRMSKFAGVCLAAVVVTVIGVLSGCGESAEPAQAKANNGAACPADLEQLLGIKSHDEKEADCEAFALKCPDAIDWSDAAQVVGESATVFGRVAGTSYRPDVAGEPTFLDIGSEFPDPRRFSAVIFREHRDDFASAPESTFLEKSVCVTGLVYERAGVQSVKITDPSQITIFP